ncbi:PAS domain S-box-containing protein [Edaphobacter aggregans]|uniref:PAS domain S-box-containing protein n=1 Tax=Edaphobacter aggregans TaxID=570835 RepID=A0A428MMN8_9BACT|nr:EAL domain-containing protein [Edaphobacter aggregans]RSL18130.1 PAS domain S-box-containing protein [Edaphobacter aggregans]
MADEKQFDLRRALDANEIIPYFQPMVELRTGKLTGFEILARWRHPQRGIIHPDEFIPLAEQTDLIGQLTGNLLRSAFAAAAVIPPHLTLAANISLTQLTDRTLPHHIRNAAQQSNFPLDRLILEITESALLGNPELAYLIAHELKEQGSRLALDDFGIGYSSLRQLQALPFDEIKVDASFVRSMTFTRESRKIAAAIIGLGNSLGLLTVAEGIEDQNHADMLLWLGCDIGQGYLYGRAAPAEDLPATLAQRMPSPAPDLPSTPADATMPLRLEALPTHRLAQLHAIYDGAPVGLCFLDRNLRYVSVNKRLAEMNNIPVASHLGRTVSEVLPGLAARLEPYLRRALDGEVITELELTGPDPHQPGRHCTRLVSYQPARDEAEEVIGISVAVVDITARKRVEQALAESEDHYRHTVELNPQVPWTADSKGMVLDVSHRWQELTGLSREETLGDGWIKVLHPDDIQHTLATWSVSLRTGQPVDVEYRTRRRDGSWRWMRARAAPRRNAIGEIIRWYGSVEDIEDRKRVEEALRRSEARLQAIFDAVPVGIIITEAPTGRILMGNPQAERILRHPVIPHQMIDSHRRPGSINSDGHELKPGEYPLARAILQGETTSAEEFLYQSHDGSRTWLSATAAPVRGQNGEVAGGVLAIQDINEAKREKQDLLDLVSRLKCSLDPPE